jgi:methionine sulfoxide reductase heme-binding subunit
VDGDTFLWVIGRGTGAAATVALSMALLSGVALRPGFLQWFTHNRGLRAVHDAAGIIWLPLGAIHVVALLLDSQAKLTPVDVVIPFVASYGVIAIGLGTVSLDLFAVVMITSWLRDRMSLVVWLWIHRLSYVAFAAVFAHTLLSGSDFANPFLSVLAWLTLLALCAGVGIRLLRAGDRPKVRPGA